MTDTPHLSDVLDSIENQLGDKEMGFLHDFATRAVRLRAQYDEALTANEMLQASRSRLESALLGTSNLLAALCERTQAKELYVTKDELMRPETAEETLNQLQLVEDEKGIRVYIGDPPTPPARSSEATLS
jgi:hypothetical protein